MQAILTRYTEDNECMMLNTFFTIGIFCAFRMIWIASGDTHYALMKEKWNDYLHRLIENGTM